MPNSFFRSEVSSSALNREKTAADTHPDRIAGSTVFQSRVPCRHRKQQVISAAGTKNSRLIVRDVSGGTFSAMVSHRIKRLPPPIPIPDRKPSAVPIINVMGSEFNTDTGYLPIKSVFPIPGEAISPGFSFPRSLQEYRLQYFQSNMEMPAARGWVRQRKKSAEIQDRQEE